VAQHPTVGSDQGIGEQEAHMRCSLHARMVAPTRIGQGVANQQGLAQQDRLGAEPQQLLRIRTRPARPHAGSHHAKLGSGLIQQADEAVERPTQVPN
jgi:hypothetical protein